MQFRFRCDSKTERLAELRRTDPPRIESVAVYDFKFVLVPDTAGKTYFVSTPVGAMQFSTLRADSFEVGQDYTFAHWRI